MFKASCAAIAAALLTGTAVTAVAQPTAAPTPTQAPTDAKAAQDANEIVCQKQEVTGSRLGVKRICMTRSQWADRRMQDRQELERVQVQRGAKGE
jgi:invasion protein IalB